MKRIISILMIVSALALPAFAAKVTFHASIAGANEVPSTASPAWGVASMEFDPATGWFRLVVNLKDVDEVITNAHIHAAPAGSAGGIVAPLGGEDPLGGASAYRRVAGKNLHATFTGTIPADKIETLLGNGCYVNFHTATYPGSATRGQLIANDVMLWAEMIGANETPPTDSPATGFAAITYNPGTKQTSVLVEVEDFANQVSASHIHEAPVGVAGLPKLNLGGENAYVRVGNDLTGEFLNKTYGGSSLLLLTGGAYINLHSDGFIGEIRGQIYGN